MNKYVFNCSICLYSITHASEEEIECVNTWFETNVGNIYGLFTSYSHFNTNFSSFNWFLADIYDK